MFRCVRYILYVSRTPWTFHHHATGGHHIPSYRTLSHRLQSFDVSYIYKEDGYVVTSWILPFELCVWPVLFFYVLVWDFPVFWLLCATAPAACITDHGFGSVSRKCYIVTILCMTLDCLSFMFFGLWTLFLLDFIWILIIPLRIRSIR